MMNADWIDAAYREHFRDTPKDERHGWSFMYTPEARLRTAKVMLVGLNPGGGHVTDAGQWAPEAGNAYVDDKTWGSDGELNPLQRQVVAMINGISVDPSKDVFAAQLVPFRSPSWDELPNREEALTTSLALWRWLLPQSPARLFLSLGKRAGTEIAKLLGAPFRTSHPVGWGRQFIDEYVDGSGRVVLALPHLSRYKLFDTGRPQALEVMKRAAAQTNSA